MDPLEEVKFTLSAVFMAAIYLVWLIDDSRPAKGRNTLFIEGRHVTALFDSLVVLILIRDVFCMY
jgi:hypothetical protein